MVTAGSVFTESCHSASALSRDSNLLLFHRYHGNCVMTPLDFHRKIVLLFHASKIILASKKRVFQTS